ncbi:M48 family metallopeptidase [Salinilacihabitans rarus]|uniref:M48 family metallopeptidase n=1 Tax=Salinilacihabitans rarus TaxID=2961596 RepID=UPI0020C8C668|nr:M48 family metalloprotease [Salinilacihabitans rarus]
MVRPTARLLHLRLAVTLLGLLVAGLAATAALAVVVAAAGLGVVGVVVAFLPVVEPETLPTGPAAGALVALVTLVLVGAVLWTERDAPEYAVAATGARPVDEEGDADLLALVGSVAQRSDTPVPRVYVAPTETPLSLTTGFTAERARLIVSEGLRSRLDRRELEAVVAHELAHVKNRDAAVMTAAALPLGAAERVRDLLSGPTAGVAHGQPSRAGVADAFVTVSLALVAPVWLVAHLLTASLSRGREFAADDGAVAITGDPAALASALERIDATLAERPTADVRETVVAAFAIAEPRRDEPRGLLAPVRRVVRRAFATHPDPRRRLERLRRRAREQETA